MINKEEPKIGEIWRAPNSFDYLVIADVGTDWKLSCLYNPNINLLLPKKWDLGRNGWRKV